MSKEPRREDIEKELEELEKAPLKHPKPQLHVHPFRNAVYRPGVTGFPITDPNPYFLSLLRNMRWTDWAYVGGGTAFMLWRTVLGSARPLRNAIICTSITGPIFFAIGIGNSYARLVGLKAMDQI